MVLFLVGKNLIVMIPILINKYVFKPSYNDLKFKVWKQLFFHQPNSNCDWNKLNKGSTSSLSLHPTHISYTLHRGFVFLLSSGCAAQYMVLVPSPGMEPGPPAMAARSLNQWTAKEVPHWSFLCTVPSPCLCHELYAEWIYWTFF